MFEEHAALLCIASYESSVVCMFFSLMFCVHASVNTVRGGNQIQRQSNVRETQEATLLQFLLSI